MRLFFYLFTYLTFLCSAVTAHAELIVVTDKNHSIHNIPENSKVIELDAARHLQESVSISLPQNQAQAEQIARDRLEQTGFHLSMQTAMQGVVDAWALGVAKIPAVIMDHQYVIYGESDVSAAVSKITAYRESTQ